MPSSVSRSNSCHLINTESSSLNLIGCCITVISVIVGNGCTCLQTAPLCRNQLSKPRPSSDVSRSPTLCTLNHMISPVQPKPSIPLVPLEPNETPLITSYKTKTIIRCERTTPFRFIRANFIPFHLVLMRTNSLEKPRPSLDWNVTACSSAR